MPKYTIENDAAILIVDTHASEIYSFYDLEKGYEAMWQGDPKYWKGRNPTLFPMVGSTWDKLLHIKGKTYITGNHGFARNSEFVCVNHDSYSITMRLIDNDDTLGQYPYHFEMDITYTLIHKTVDIHYTIRNTNDEIMPFHFGLHPAFNIEDDYYLQFDEAQDFTWNRTSMHNEKKLLLNMDDLSETIILHHPKGRSVYLGNGEKGVRVSYERYEWLALWSPKAPFVCVEPWLSHTDFEKVEVDYDKREGVRFINPKESFAISYKITLE